MQAFELTRNLNNLYKPGLNQKQEDFYLEFLNKFSPKQMDELWSITMQSHCRTSPPTIGELKKYSADVSKVRVLFKAEETLTDEQIFSSNLGKLSLKQGWGSSYLAECKKHGIGPQTDSEILRFQKAAHEAENLVKSLSGKKDHFSLALIKLRDSMRKNNQRLKEKFNYLLSSADISVY